MRRFRDSRGILRSDDRYRPQRMCHAHKRERGAWRRFIAIELADRRATDK